MSIVNDVEDDDQRGGEPYRPQRRRGGLPDLAGLAFLHTGLLCFQQGVIARPERAEGITHNPHAVGKRKLYHADSLTQLFLLDEEGPLLSFEQNAVAG